ncbi:hypothetical protein FDB42_17540 [Clostridium botulinum]|nr:hypothetical protein [Clostridium botulinum]
MDINEVKNLVESRGMVYKGEFLQQLSEEEFNSGMRKVNLQEIDNLDKLNGEGVWVWLSEEDRKEYDDNNSNKVIKAILANSPLAYMGILFWGSEIEIRCNYGGRPNLSKEWVAEKILNADWYEN